MTFKISVITVFNRQCCCGFFISSTQTLLYSFLWNIWKCKNAVMINHSG